VGWELVGFFAAPMQVERRMAVAVRKAVRRRGTDWQRHIQLVARLLFATRIGLDGLK